MELIHRSAVIVLLAAGVLPGQSFDVVSIKPIPVDNSHPAGFRVPTREIRGLSGTTLTEHSITVAELIMQAYDIADFQIAGGPDWTDQHGQQFQFVAKTSGVASPSVAELRQMMQSMLADRFRLKAHRTTKELPAFEVTRSKRGLKIRPIAPDTPRPAWDGRTPPPYRSSVANLLQLLQLRVQRPLLDRTELGTGLYEYKLDQIAMARCDHSDEDKDSCVAAQVEQQMGLKLTPRKSQVELMVIDHIERPSGN